MYTGLFFSLVFAHYLDQWPVTKDAKRQLSANNGSATLQPKRAMTVA